MDCEICWKKPTGLHPGLPTWNLVSLHCTPSRYMTIRCSRHMWSSCVCGTFVDDQRQHRLKHERISKVSSDCTRANLGNTARVYSGAVASNPVGTRKTKATAEVGTALWESPAGGRNSSILSYGNGNSTKNKDKKKVQSSKVGLRKVQSSERNRVRTQGTRHPEAPTWPLLPIMQLKW